MSILQFYQNKRVLITGHTGFIGSWLSYLLLNAGAEVIGFSRCRSIAPSLFELLELGREVHSFAGDIADLEQLSKAFREAKPEIVLHFAAQPLVRESYENPVLTYQTNVMGTVNMLECIRKCNSVFSVLNVTTGRVCQNKEWDYPENKELRGNDPYSSSKICSELVTDSYQKSFFADRDLAISTARAGNVIGGGDFADRIIPDCFRAASKGEEVIVRNPGAVRPYQHVLELLLAYLTIAAKQSEERELVGNYNIGPDEASCISTGKLVNLFCRSWQKYTGVNLGWADQSNCSSQEMEFLKLDCERFKKAFAWKPVWHIDKAVDQTVKWYSAYAAGEDLKAVMKTQLEEFVKEESDIDVNITILQK